MSSKRVNSKPVKHLTPRSKDFFMKLVRQMTGPEIQVVIDICFSELQRRKGRKPEETLDEYLARTKRRS